MAEVSTHRFSALAKRVTQLEQQLAELTRACELHGVQVIKCDFCKDILHNQFTCPGLRPMWTNSAGPGGIALKDGRYTRYYCQNCIPEAWEDVAEWTERDKERAEYAIAYWLLTYAPEPRPGGSGTTPERSRALKDYPEVQELMIVLKEEEHNARE